MPLRIEDYALIGDCQTAALVSRDGSIDWLCFPAFDSRACFAALLGTEKNGRWLLAPAGEVKKTSRRYLQDTLILETEFETDTGTAILTDFMPIRGDLPDLVRIVRGIRGEVKMRMELIIRFDYGSIVPWVQKVDHGISAIAGPDMLVLRTPVPMHGKELTTVAEFTVKEGQTIPFDLTWFPSHVPLPKMRDVRMCLEQTKAFWHEWTSHCTYTGEYREAVMRSLITLKALTYSPTGGIVAAPTTSLPEKLGGIRNWDYRYCWIRDSTFTLLALINSGFKQEAAEWREWLLRAIAGDPAQLNIMYGICADRRLPEIELPWLPGYEQSQPVRIGNAAYKQFQLDVFGEVMDTLYHCRRLQFCDDSGPHIEPLMMEFLATAWQRPDEGIWEVRGGARQFTHSKMMAWVAFDRAIRSATELKVDGPVKKWRKIAHEIHSQICELGFDKSLNSFVQSYGSKDLDASLLMMPLVGFLPATDPRVLGTVKAIEQNLMRDGLIDRYSNRPEVDGLPPGEGSFLPCTFWLADNYILQNRVEEARHIFQRLLDVRNDVGLLSEEYDSDRKRLLGNFPQAFSHIALINTAWRLANHGSETKVRRESSEVQDVPAKVRSQV